MIFSFPIVVQDIVCISEWNSVQVIKYLISDDLGLAPIHQLAREGDKKRVKKLTKAHRGFNFLRLK